CNSRRAWSTSNTQALISMALPHFVAFFTVYGEIRLESSVFWRYYGIATKFGRGYRGTAVVGRHLSSVHQSGSAGRAAGGGVAEHAGTVGHARIQRGRHFHHHRFGHGGVQLAERPADAQTGRGAGDGAERASD